MRMRRMREHQETSLRRNNCIVLFGLFSSFFFLKFQIVLVPDDLERSRMWKDYADLMFERF